MKIQSHACFVVSFSNMPAETLDSPDSYQLFMQFATELFAIAEIPVVAVGFEQDGPGGKVDTVHVAVISDSVKLAVFLLDIETVIAQLTGGYPWRN